MQIALSPVIWIFWFVSTIAKFLSLIASFAQSHLISLEFLDPPFGSNDSIVAQCPLLVGPAGKFENGWIVHQSIQRIASGGLDSLENGRGFVSGFTIAFAYEEVCYSVVILRRNHGFFHLLTVDYVLFEPSVRTSGTKRFASTDKMRRDFVIGSTTGSRLFSHIGMLKKCLDEQALYSINDVSQISIPQ